MLSSIDYYLRDSSRGFARIQQGQIPDGSGANLATVTDHGSLLGLSDDDHSQYFLLAGRAGGTVALGSDSTSAGDVLDLTAYNNPPIAGISGISSRSAMIRQGQTTSIFTDALYVVERNTSYGSSAGLTVLTGAGFANVELYGGSLTLNANSAGAGPTLEVDNTGAGASQATVLSKFRGKTSATVQTGDLTQWYNTAAVKTLWVDKDAVLHGPITTTSAVSVTDSLFNIVDDDAVGIAQFQCGLLAAGTNVFTFPATAAGTFAMVNLAQTFTKPQVIDNDTASDVLLKLVPHASQSVDVLQVRDITDTFTPFGVSSLNIPTFGGALVGTIPFSIPIDGAFGLAWGQLQDAASGSVLFLEVDGNPDLNASLIFPRVGGTVLTGLNTVTGITNKTFGTTANTLRCTTVGGAGVAFEDNTTTSKKLRFVLGGSVGTSHIVISNTAARTYTFPDYAMIVAGSASALTATRVPFAGTAGILTDDADMTFATDRLTVTKLTSTLATLTAGTAPTPATGDIYNDSARKALIGFPNAIKQSLDGTLFTQTNSVTYGPSSITETSIVGTGQGTKTLPADWYTVGKTVKVTLYGYCSNVAGHALRIRAKLIDSTPTTVLLCDTTAGTLATASSDDQFMVSLIITCRTTGATGTVMSQMSVFPEGNAAFPQAVNTTTATIDTTKTQQIEITAQWGTSHASNTMTITNLAIQTLNEPA
jgi:hypothetical protein